MEVRLDVFDALLVVGENVGVWGVALNRGLLMWWWCRLPVESMSSSVVFLAFITRNCSASSLEGKLLKHAPL